jgi:hypothetical protein
MNSNLDLDLSYYIANNLLFNNYYRNTKIIRPKGNSTENNDKLVLYDVEKMGTQIKLGGYLEYVKPPYFDFTNINMNLGYGGSLPLPLITSMSLPPTTPPLGYSNGSLPLPLITSMSLSPYPINESNRKKLGATWQETVLSPLNNVLLTTIDNLSTPIITLIQNMTNDPNLQNILKNLFEQIIKSIYESTAELTPLVTDTFLEITKSLSIQISNNLPLIQSKLEEIKPQLITILTGIEPNLTLLIKQIITPFTNSISEIISNTTFKLGGNGTPYKKQKLSGLFDFMTILNNVSTAASTMPQTSGSTISTISTTINPADPSNQCNVIGQKYLNLISKTPGRPIQIGNWSDVPYGCSVQSKGDYTIHYNTNQNGTSNLYTLLPNTDYEVENIAKCTITGEKYLKDNSKTSEYGTQAGSWSWIPPGCSIQSSGGNTIYYNTDLNGSNNESYIKLNEFGKGLLLKIFQSVINSSIKTGSLVIGETSGEISNIITNLVPILSSISYKIVSKLADNDFVLASELEKFYNDNGIEIFTKFITIILNNIKSVFAFIEKNPDMYKIITSLGSRGIINLTHIINYILSITINNGFTAINTIIINSIKKSNDVIATQLLENINKGLNTLTNELINESGTIINITKETLNKSLNESLNVLNSARDNILKYIKTSSLSIINKISDQNNVLTDAQTFINPIILNAKQAALVKIQDLSDTVIQKMTNNMDNLFDKLTNEMNGIVDDMVSESNSMNPYNIVKSAGKFIGSNKMIFILFIVLVILMFVLKYFNIV